MNAKTFNVPVSNGLLEPKHYRAMGDAIWLYLHLLDKQTRGVDKDGNGKVSGGMPIRDSVIAGALGSSRRTVIRWRGVLKRGDYITALRTPFGHVYAITKPKKWKETTKGDVTQPVHNSPNDSDVMCRFGTGDVLAHHLQEIRLQVAGRPVPERRLGYRCRSRLFVRLPRLLGFNAF